MKKLLIYSLLAIMAAAVSSCNDDDVTNPEVSVINDAEAFVWNGENIALDADNGWSLSRTNSWIAVTNNGQQTQYMLKWQGGMATGAKTDATLSFAVNGGKPVTTPVSDMSLTTDGTRCQIVFTADGRAGSLTFAIN